MSSSSSNKSFASTSPTDVPSILHLSCPPGSNLGAVLVNCDKKAESEIFLPGFATVGRLLPGDTVARQGGVQPGDVIVAVNGVGYRRFAPDYPLDKANVLTSSSDVTVELNHAVVEPGTAYEHMLAKIKALKASGETFTLTLERYGWDARPLAWSRFLTARDNNVMEAMSLFQTHEVWKTNTFPIPLQTPGLQTILRTKAVSEIDIESSSGGDESDSLSVPTVYVNYAKLLELQTAGEITGDDVVLAFVIFTERMLAKNLDARHPKTTQFIDLTGVSISSGFRVDTLKKIYHVFEPNYPETLHKMVMYPVTSVLATTARTMLSFVNERTQKKFLITNDLSTVCKDLGWNQTEIEDCGGITEFMHKHEKAGTSMIMDDDPNNAAESG